MTSRIIRYGAGHPNPGALKAIVVSCDRMDCDMHVNDKHISERAPPIRTTQRGRRIRQLLLRLQRMGLMDVWTGTDEQLAQGMRSLKGECCTLSHQRALANEVQRRGLMKFHEWPSGHWAYTERGLNFVCDRNWKYQ